MQPHCKLISSGDRGRLPEWKHIGSVAALTGLAGTAGESSRPIMGGYLAALGAIVAVRPAGRMISTYSNGSNGDIWHSDPGSLNVP